MKCLDQDNSKHQQKATSMYKPIILAFHLKTHTMRYSLLLLLTACCFSLQAQNSRFVNVFIGTDGTGHTFPGPSMPFGMVQPGPDNRDFGWNHTSGYQYHDTMLLGFSQTRFSGTGINEMGDILLLPINPKKADRKNSYIKSTEKAEPGYYTLQKGDDVKVELTCSDRVAWHRYTFPNPKAQLLIDFQHGLRFVFDPSHQQPLVIASSIQLENNTTISGYCATKNWVSRKYFFTIEFNQPFTTYDTLPGRLGEQAPRYLLHFNTAKQKTLLTKIALSTVSIEGAKRNLLAEAPHWNFNHIQNQNKVSWNKLLNRVTIDATSKQRHIFYTALYHLFLQPSNIADVDGQYRGADDHIRTAPQRAYYSTLSNWDVYRAAFPLLQLLVPERINGIINSMLDHHEAAGFLPIWTAWGQDNYCMIGNHAIPMIVSAYQNGFRGFDAQRALKAIIETSTRSHINSDWELYNRYGYYPFNKLDNEAVSRTLESGYDDWCVAWMAEQLGDVKTAGTFFKRAAYYRNLFDPTTQFFRGKDTAGNWRTPFDPLIATSPLNNPGDYTEANAWQYFWTPAQHDVNGIIELLGGREAFTQKLEAFFTTHAAQDNKFLGQEAMIGQYAHGNEPSHHIAYLYNYSNTPKRGQDLIRQIVDAFHNNSPDGMIGNDDCGQMSAWYILSTLGFYPVNPANGQFELGVPQVRRATIHQPNGNDLHIHAKNFRAANRYRNSVSMQGKPLTQSFIRFNELQQGGHLIFNMTSR